MKATGMQIQRPQKPNAQPRPHAPRDDRTPRTASEVERDNRALRRAMAATGEIAEAASRTGDPLAVAAVANDRIKRLLDVPGTWIFMFDPHSGLLQSINPDPNGRVYTVRPGEGISGSVFASGKPLTTERYTAWSGASSVTAGFGIQSVLAVPLIFEGRPVGTLCVWSLDQRVFTRREADVLALLAAQVTPLLETARLATERRAEAYAFEALIEIARRAGEMEPEALGHAIASTATDLLGIDMCRIAQWRDGALRLINWPDFLESDLVPPDTALREAFTQSRPVIMETSPDGPETARPAMHEDCATVVAIPFMNEQGPFGALAAGYRAHHDFRPQDLDTLKLFASQVGHVLDAAKMAREREALMSALQAMGSDWPGESRGSEMGTLASTEPKREWNAFLDSISRTASLAHENAHLHRELQLERARSVAAETAPPTPAPKLTRSQEMVLRLLVEGNSNAEIGKAMHVSANTVKFHLHNLYALCQVESRVDLVARALRNGWV